jgi:hypothetical protein
MHGERVSSCMVHVSHGDAGNWRQDFAGLVPDDESFPSWHGDHLTNKSTNMCQAPIIQDFLSERS